MPEKTYKLEVTWSMSAQIVVEAESLEEAINKSKRAGPLPRDSDYVGDSFEVSYVVFGDGAGFDRLPVEEALDREKEDESQEEKVHDLTDRMMAESNRAFFLLHRAIQGDHKALENAEKMLDDVGYDPVLLGDEEPDEDDEE